RRIDVAVRERDVGCREAAVERVEESVLRIDELPVARVHLLGGRDGDLGGEGQARNGGGRRDGPVVERLRTAGAARRVVEKVARAPGTVRQVHLAWTVARGEAPDVRADVEPPLRVGDGEG